MDKVEDIVKSFGNCKPLRLDLFESRFSSLAILLLKVAAGSFIVFALVYGFCFFTGVFSELLQLVINLLAIVTLVVALGSAFTWSLGGILDGWDWVVKKFKGTDAIDDANLALLVIQHDERHAKNLERYEMADLKRVACWLDRLIKRRENRIFYFFGNQATFISLIIAFIYFFDRMDGMEALMDTMTNGLRKYGIVSMVIVLVLSCLMALIVGCLALKAEIKNYMYWHDLVDLAMQKKEIEQAKEDSLPVEPAVSIDTSVAQLQGVPWGKRFSVLFSGRL